MPSKLNGISARASLEWRRRCALVGALGTATLLLAACLGSTDPRSSWARSYGGPDFDRAAAVEQTADGGYIMVGTTGGRPNPSGDLDAKGEGDVWAQKLDATGEVEWSHAYGDVGLGDSTPRAVESTADGGLLLGANTIPPVNRPGSPTSPTAMRLTKLDAAGHLVWSRTYPPMRSDLGALASAGFYAPTETLNSVREVPGGGFVVAGTSDADIDRNGLASRTTAVVLRVSATGEVLWEHYFDLHDEADFTDIGFSGQALGGETAELALPLASGNILVIGTSTASVEPTGVTGQLLPTTGALTMMLTASGDVLSSTPAHTSGRFAYDGDHEWQREASIFSAATALGSGSAIAGIETRFGSNIGVNPGPLIRFYDAAGSNQHDVVLPWSDDQAVTAMTQFEGTVLVAGVAGSFADKRAYLVRVATSGQVLWRQLYEAAGTPTSMTLATDGSLVVSCTGSRTAFLVLRVDPVSGRELTRYAYTASPAGLALFEAASSVTATADGFAVAGDTATGGRLLRARSDGSVVWYIGPRPDPALPDRPSGLDEGRAIVPTDDGGYLIAAQSASVSTSGMPVTWLLKIDADGNTRWERTLPINDPRTLIRDGSGFLLGGRVEDRNDDRAVIVGLDSEGVPLWQTRIESQGQAVSALRAVPSGGSIATLIDEQALPGFVQVPSVAPALVKIGAQGAIEWERSYSTPAAPGVFQSVELAPDGGYVAAGTTFVTADGGSSSGGGTSNVWVLHVDAMGEILWQYAYGGGSAYAQGNVVRATRDGGYVIVGSTGPLAHAECLATQSAQPCDSIWLLKLNQFGRMGLDASGNPFSGQMTFDRAFSIGRNSFDDAIAFDVHETREGSFIIAGETDGISGSFDAWLLKVAPDGSFGAGCASGLTAASVGGDIDGTPQPLSSKVLAAPSSGLSLAPHTVSLAARSGPTDVAEECSATGSPVAPLPPSPAPTPNPQAPDFLFGATPKTLSIAQGASASAIIGANGIGGFSGQLGLSVSGAPPGVTVTLAPTIISVNAGGATNSTLTVTVGSSVAPASVMLTLTAIGADASGVVISHTTQLPLTITSSGVPPTPQIDSITPNGVAAGSPALTLTVNGSGFVPASQVLWNGMLTGTATHFVSPSQLTVPIPAALLTTPHQSLDSTTVAVSVRNTLSTDSNTATFSLTGSGVPTTFTLTLTVVGQGRVTSAPAGIDCPSQCTASFAQDAVVVLTATPASGYVFSGWSGDAQCASQLTLNGNHACTATFTRQAGTTARVSVTLAGNGTGGVVSTPVGIECNTGANVCSAEFPISSIVTLTATPASGSSLSPGGITGCDNYGPDNCELNVAGNGRNVTVTFDLLVGLHASLALTWITADTLQADARASTGHIIRYEFWENWTPGDTAPANKSGTAAVVTWFADPGTTVRLRVTDNNLNTDSVTAVVPPH
jgi:hypothetical protein